MAWVWVDDEDDYVPDWQPAPGHPGWSYDANLGPYVDGKMTLRGGIPTARWREIVARAP